MAVIREPRSTEQAAALLEQYAELDGQIAAIEADRRESIATINADCDRAANALIAQRDAMRAKLEPWWAKNGATLTEGKRKSIELGGCIIGSRAGAVSLAVKGDEKALALRMLKLRWAKPFLRPSVALEKKVILKALDGKRAAELAELGFSKSDGEETFTLERVQQNGTLGGS